MLVKYEEKEYKICPALRVIVCKLVAFCDKFDLPLNVYSSKESEIEFLTEGWSEHIIHKYYFHTKADYSELALAGVSLCTIRPNSIKIIVNPNKDINQFQRS